MKNIFLLLTFFVGLNQAKAIYISHCSNYGPSVQYFFERCVNRNFDEIRYAIGGYYQTCYSNGNAGVDFAFSNCIDYNFRRVTYSPKLSSVYLRTCRNYSTDTVDYIYVSCINDNFQRISRAIGP